MELPDATKKKIIFIKVIVYKLLLWKERTRIHHLSKLSELQHRIMPLKTHFWTCLAYNFFYNTTPKYTLHFKGHVQDNDKWWNGYSTIKERYNPQKWKTGKKILKSEQVKIRRTIPHIASSHPLKGKKRPQNTQTTVIFAPFFLSYFLFLTPFLLFSSSNTFTQKKTTLILWHFFQFKKKTFSSHASIFCGIGPMLAQVQNNPD